MDKKQFIDMTAAPERFSSQDRGWLKAMLAKYPYSSVVSTLALLADHAFGYDTPVERRAVALSVCNPAVLDGLMAGAVTATATPAPAPQNVVDTNFDILSEINTFQEVSFKTAKKSLTPDVSLGTETLAVILEKQGRYDKALAIYKNLLAHNPEKSSIFAPRIERLTSLINSK